MQRWQERWLWAVLYWLYCCEAYARDRERLEGTWLEVKAGYSGESQKSPESEAVPLYNGCKLTGQSGKCLKLSSNREVGNWQLLVMEHPAMLHILPSQQS